MANAIAHRGPDGQSTWVEGSMGMAHALFATTPEAKYEKQPLVEPSGRYVLVADGRIDNRAALMVRLGLRRSTDRLLTDPEIMLSAYRRWGRACPEHLVGAYAFVVWDRKAQTLYCCRDHMGIKPLFYYASERFFAFASEIKALFRLTDVPRRLNEERIADLLTVVIRDATTTFYHGVRHVAPGRYLSVAADGRVHDRQYWSVDDDFADRRPDGGDAVRVFRDTFEEAVRCRLRARRPVASALSGGLDSSSITAMAADLLHRDGRGPLHTCSATFPRLKGEAARPIDERRYAEAVVQAKPVAPHFIEADQSSPLQFVDAMLDASDESFWSPNAYMHWLLYQMARTHGARVFLDGLDGDSVVSHGGRYLTELLFNRQWAAYEAEVRAVAARAGRAPRHVAERTSTAFFRQLTPSDGPVLIAAVRWLARQYDLPIRTLVRKMSVTRVLPRSWEPLLRRLTGRGRPEVIAPAFARRMGLSARGFLQRPPATYRTQYEAHVMGLQDPRHALTLSLADRQAAAHGIEPRYPFYDRRLIELSLALPAATKLHDGWTRYVLRAAMKDVLPEAVRCRRDKALLGANLDRNLPGRDGPRIERIIQNTTHPVFDYAARERVAQTYERLKEAAKNGQVQRNDTILVYTVAMLALWLEREAEH